MYHNRKQILINAIKTLIYGMCVAILLVFLAFVIGFALHFTIAAFWGGWNFYHGK